MATVASGAGLESQAILVVGGGIAGVTAALEAAEAGQDVNSHRARSEPGRSRRKGSIAIFLSSAIQIAGWRSTTNAFVGTHGSG